MRMATGLARLAAVFLLAGGLSACGGESGGGAGRGTVVAGLRTDLQGINPITAGDQYTVEIINYALFTPLIQYDAGLQVRPHLAEAWQLTGDTGVVFTLRRDVKWHDGQPVTAEDVQFTFDMAKDPASASLIGSAFVTNVDRAEVVDSFTIRFRFTRPHAQALEDFWWAPAPKHLLQNVSAADIRNAAFNRQPVGSGPYRFVEWHANQRIVLERNPDYPEALGGPAAATRLVLRIIPEPSTMLTELVTGSVHVDIPLLPDQAGQVKQNADLHFWSFPGKSLYYIGWNNQREPFTSANVRRALTLGINRQEIINALLYGEGALATGPIPPWHPMYAQNVQPLQFDAAEAERLLESEGWRDTNGDGIRDKGGRPFRFTLLTSDNTLNRAVVEMVQAQLRRIGVHADIRVMEFQTLLAQHRSRDFDAVFSAWVLDNFQVAAAPNALLHSRLAGVANSTNRSSVRIPALDQLIERGSAATSDQQARVVWQEFTEVLQREQPLTFMYWLNELAASRRSLGGVTMDPRGEFVSVSAWTPGGR